jgi:hypothetical protein
MEQDDKDRKEEDGKSYLHSNNGSSDVQQNHDSNQRIISDLRHKHISYYNLFIVLLVQ